MAAKHVSVRTAGGSYAEPSDHLARHAVRPVEVRQGVVDLESLERHVIEGLGEQVAAERAEDALCRERVRDDRDAVLILDGAHGIARAHSGRNLVLDVQPDDVPLFRRNFLAHHHLEVIQLLEGLREARTVHRVVIGDCDDVEVRLVLDVLHDLGNARQTIGVVGVDVKIGLAPDFSLHCECPLMNG